MLQLQSSCFMTQEFWEKLKIAWENSFGTVIDDKSLASIPIDGEHGFTHVEFKWIAQCRIFLKLKLSNPIRRRSVLYLPIPTTKTTVSRLHNLQRRARRTGGQRGACALSRRRAIGRALAGGQWRMRAPPPPGGDGGGHCRSDNPPPPRPAHQVPELRHNLTVVPNVKKH